LTDKGLKEIFDKGIFNGEIKFDEPLSQYTSLKIGGPADILVFPNDAKSLKNVLKAVEREKIPVTVLGAGTNLIVRDGGLEGVAISLMKFRNIELIRNIKHVAPFLSAETDNEKFGALFVEAGCPLGNLIDSAMKSGLSGIEPLAGIPGSVGGAIFMNAGSFGADIKDVILSVAFMKMNGEIVILENESIDFSYRQTIIPEKTIILSANIILNRDTPDSISLRIREFLKKRRQSQPVGKPSAGCVFKNPEGDSAGRLIDEAGCKGMTTGGLEVSHVHANYFTSREGATSRDFLHLMEAVKKRVRDSTGITLEPEISIIGRNE
jgi:UDP-N-acetylmuramate dehydrogenase